MDNFSTMDFFLVVAKTKWQMKTDINWFFFLEKIDLRTPKKFKNIDEDNRYEIRK